ncbi:hypothetical protein B0H14DRAFT_3523213 [Mycena olivaceomarginata]|nr:hypothetical protein B0H14DRAFT_3523213 [Mycena olivaceomarginata]
MPAGIPLSAKRRIAEPEEHYFALQPHPHHTRVTEHRRRPAAHPNTYPQREPSPIVGAKRDKEGRAAASNYVTRKRERHDALMDIADPFDDGDGGYEADVLRGNAAADISHAGEGIQEEEADQADKDLIYELLLSPLLQQKSLQAASRSSQPRGPGRRTLLTLFAAQLDAMTDAYMSWSLAMAEEGVGGEGDTFMASAYVRQGLMPSTPLHPTVVVTVRTLELFRVMQLRCPRLGVQAFVRGLCDLHSITPQPLSRLTVLDCLRRLSLNPRRACLYKLEGEPQLPRAFISTMDGNNSPQTLLAAGACGSSWRMARPSLAHRSNGLAAMLKTEPQYVSVRATSKEQRDNRQPWETTTSLERRLMRVLCPALAEDEDEGAGCEERWENMKEDCHGSRVGDPWIRAGRRSIWCKVEELSKYGFAVLNHLISVLGEVTMGHDIGCKTAKMSVVGAFHGLGHGRLCSVCNMSMYVNGMGLEDCENCESYFSKSNGLASITRYSTVFHRQQAIVNYMKHTDLCDAYQGLTIVISNKYRRALKMKRGLPALQEAMRALGVPTRDVFEDWLEKEKRFLRLLTKEPVQETQEMEYYQKLVNFYACEYVYRTATISGANSISESASSSMQRAEAFVVEPAAPNYAESMKQTRRLETQQRHAYELVSKSLAAVQDLELRLGIASRWVAGDEDWSKAAEMVSKRRYQRALDQLQGLVVARMFELCKMNMSGTGYKLRKHIAKSHQVRSRAVKTALERYNAAAAAMDPAKPQLAWEKVVEYAFLAEFDLLREGREDIRAEPWALPAGRAAMDQHFKMVRAEEEIQRLNVEIPRLITYMADELYSHRIEYGRFDDLHRQRLWKLCKEPGFTASLARGTGGDVDMPDALQVPQRALEEDEEEEEDEGDMDAIVEAFDNIVRITHDATCCSFI